jgi:hypothetical protein
MTKNRWEIKRPEFRIGKPVLLILLAGLAAQAQAPEAGETTQAKIARALSAAPPDVAKSARVVDKDAQGKMLVLREGTNGFTCMPGNPKVIGDPPMCADAASMQWAADFKAHSRSRATRFRASLTCWQELRNAAIRILMIQPARPFT